jgi:hypothetical protein
MSLPEGNSFVFHALFPRISMRFEGKQNKTKQTISQGNRHFKCFVINREKNKNIHSCISCK